MKKVASLLFSTFACAALYPVPAEPGHVDQQTQPDRISVYQRHITPHDDARDVLTAEAFGWVTQYKIKHYGLDGDSSALCVADHEWNIILDYIMNDLGLFKEAGRLATVDSNLDVFVAYIKKHAIEPYCFQQFKDDRCGHLPDARAMVGASDHARRALDIDKVDRKARVYAAKMIHQATGPHLEK